MTDDDGSIYSVLDRAAAGAVSDPPIGAVMAAGRARLRHRRVAQVATTVVAVAAMVVGAVALATDSSTTHSPQPAKTPPVVGPSAERLAHGRWVAVAPVAEFGGRSAAPGPGHDSWDPAPGAVWDGSGLVLLGPKAPTGALEAISYDPRGNRWRTLPTPPAAVGPNPFPAGGDDQLVLVSIDSGATASWRPETNRWTTLPTLPAKGVISLTWTGKRFLAIAVDPTAGPRRGFASYHPAHAFTLGPEGWHQLQNLPRPAMGSVREAPAAVYGGAVYVLASSVVRHGSAAPSSDTGSVQLLRLGPGGWTKVPGTAGLPVSTLSLHSLDGAILATGASCPETVNCLPKVAALIRPGPTAGVTVLRPPGGASIADYEVTGGDATVAVNSSSYWLYDVAALRWIRGPARPFTPTALDAGAYWTPYGVVSNGSLLRPAPKARTR
jgi:hypothetical protein